MPATTKVAFRHGCSRDADRAGPVVLGPGGRPEPDRLAPVEGPQDVLDRPQPFGEAGSYVRPTRPFSPAAQQVNPTQSTVSKLPVSATFQLLPSFETSVPDGPTATSPLPR